jgi:hypothetical protein
VIWWSCFKEIETTNGTQLNIKKNHKLKTLGHVVGLDAPVHRPGAVIGPTRQWICSPPSLSSNLI